MPKPFASCFNKKLQQNTRATKFRGGYFHGGEISQRDEQSEETKSLRSQGGGSFAGFGDYNQCCLKLISKS